MNKQYVKEQIDIAINELRKEYDAVIGNIYQCPDCGALAFRNSEHICFKAVPAAVSQPLPPTRSSLVDRVYDALPIGAPPAGVDTFGIESDYSPEKIISIVSGPAGSIKATLSYLWKSGKIKRRPAALVGKRNRADGIPGFVYWRTV